MVSLCMPIDLCEDGRKNWLLSDTYVVSQHNVIDTNIFVATAGGRL